MTDEILAHLREALDDIDLTFDRAVLFGSVARGENGPESESEGVILK